MHGKQRRDFYDRGAHGEPTSKAVEPMEPEEDLEPIEDVTASDDENEDDLPKEPPIDGRLVVLIMPDGAAVTVRAKTSRRFVRGQGWQQYRQWISALTSEPVAEPYASWRPWPREFAA